MNHTLDVLVPAISVDDRLAWIALAEMRGQPVSGPVPDVLMRFHATLVAVYPCLASYQWDDPTVDECPWTQGRLIRGFGSRRATLELRASSVDGVLDFILRTAGTLGLTVFDKQRGQIHRPPARLPVGNYEIHVHGVRPGFSRDGVVTRIADTFRQDPARIRRMLDTPRARVKQRSDRLSALRCQALLSRLGCSCSIVAEQPTMRPVTDISLAGGNQPADLMCLRQCAMLGHAESQYQLGFLLLHGVDLAQDSVKGVKWIEAAAQQGNGEAQWAMALCYREGNGVFKSYARALEWMRKAALQGDPQAQTSVGRIYCKGEGVQPDLAEARRWFRLAAAQGDSQGQYLLGKMLDDGQGGAPDCQQAAALFIRAAQLGNLDAKLRLQA
jgi:hypothetical protein